MNSRTPTQALRRVNASSSCTCSKQQIRHASLLKRPHRPYTFTQLITLSDGSTYTQRTTSPAPIYKSTKDTRNHPLWQPSLTSLRNIEEDEAGRLASFRAKFGRGWDVQGKSEEDGEGEAADGAQEDQEESLMDLISGYAASSQDVTSGKREEKIKSVKGSGGQK